MVQAVTVALRVRPLVKSELDRGCRIAVQRAAAGAPQVVVNGSDCFTYNYVFDSEDTQQDLYEQCVRSKLQKLLKGFNVTILAYGQTGSGKTYTMGTAFNGEMDDNAGVIPRAIQEIFERTAANENHEFKITCSFVELYQEQLYDLLSSKRREDSTVDIREDQNRIIIHRLTEVEVNGPQQVTDQLIRGCSGRMVASTAMNETSSRSHAIFTVTVVATSKQTEGSMTISKFNLVDLAGSERCAKTLACGDRLKEGININKGLLALGSVINALGAGQAGGHVPYRQSKLTRLLQDSLGGNSITVMIACVSPADYNVSETLSTLRYADRALQIKNKPVVNVDPHAAQVMKLNEVIQQLRSRLASYGDDSSNVGNAVAVSGANGDEVAVNDQPRREQLEQLQEENTSIKKKYGRLQQQLQQSLSDLAENQMRAHIAEASNEKLKSHVLQLTQKLTEKAVPKMKELLEQSNNDAELQQELQEITQLVSTVGEELQQSEHDIQSHRDECLSGPSEEPVSGSDEANELLVSRSEEHTQKQLNLNDELRHINRQLALKTDLHDRVTRNFDQLPNDDLAERMKQSQIKIDNLESERCELIDLLRTKSKDASAKLAEERRKRLVILQQEVTEHRRKIVQQAGMLKMREKEREKIQNLSSEIRAMKEAKVKLIRAMKGEANRFRQWKLMSERELTQLKSKDRKLQSEMARKDTLHAKQHLVLKRKCDEAMAANARLKDAMARQHAAMRQRKGKNPTGEQNINALVDSRVEAIFSLIDAERTLQQLMEDRASVTAQCNAIKEQDAQPEGEQAQLLATLEEQLEMQNAQIANLQQKVCLYDLDDCMRTLCEDVQSILDSRATSKQLLKSLLHQKQLFDEQRGQLHDATQKYDELAIRLREAERQHAELMDIQQRSYEEKVAVLLRNGSEAMPSSKNMGEAEMSKKTKALSSKPKVEHVLSENAELLTEFESDGDADIDEMDNTLGSDIEWVPQPKRSKKSNTQDPQQNNNSTSSNKNVNNNDNNNTLSSTLQTSLGNRSVSKCKCRKQCNTKRCGCCATGSGCNRLCKCYGNCQNPNNEPDSGNGGDCIDENSIPAVEDEAQDNGTMAVDTSRIDKNRETINMDVTQILVTQSGSNTEVEVTNSSKLALSQLSFNTPSSKKKFF